VTKKKVELGKNLEDIVCSFCEKSAKDVATIIKSVVTCEPSYICNECVVICVQIFIERNKIITFERAKQ